MYELFNNLLFIVFLIHFFKHTYVETIVRNDGLKLVTKFASEMEDDFSKVPNTFHDLKAIHIKLVFKFVMTDII